MDFARVAPDVPIHGDAVIKGHARLRESDHFPSWNRGTALDARLARRSLYSRRVTRLQAR